jgi:argininosuccinate lyase
MRYDDFEFLILLNKAQLVSLKEEQLLNGDTAHRIATAISALLEESTSEDLRSSDYLSFEKRLIERMGDDASNLHMGRSRNDIGASRERMWMRQEFMNIMPLFITAKSRLLEIAAQHKETIIPSYTHAVQAQPISLAHYLLALAASFSRDMERLKHAYTNLNQSPLGAGALATSGFPLNRDRLKQLLGFSKLCENSYDSIGAATVDTKVEFCSALSICALNIGRFAQDLLIQHADPLPAITLGDGLVGGSSIMPQKRNPGPLEKLRTLASHVVADAHAVSIMTHNTPFGDVADARGIGLQRVLMVTGHAYKMVKELGNILEGLVVFPELSMKKLENDYSTMTEVAEMLLREFGLPFRIGHKVAKELTLLGRSAGIAPSQIDFEAISKLYVGITGQAIPFNKERYLLAVDPKEFVFSRAGLGGPQPSETGRMLEAQLADLEAFQQWFEAEAEFVQDAYQHLEDSFRKLLVLS